MESDVERANQLLRELHEVSKQLRRTDEGREAIAGLMSDEVVAVRLLAATDGLGWQPERAESVLHEIEQLDGLYAVDAKWTLRSYRSGTLDLDW
jgi:Domain of unknown function (DUF2019)